MVVTFTAPCPNCRQPALWTQTVPAGGFGYNPDDMRITCRCNDTHVA